MASTYRGLYRIGPKDAPTDVQVQDPGGNSLPLPLDTYVVRGVLPVWQELPTDRQYRAILAVSCLEKGETHNVNVGDAEECVEAGWLDALAPNRWILTKAGKKFL